MSSGHALTYLATDIIGYSILTQNDQRKAIDLLETYQSILIPLIEKEGGAAIVCTGDAITASFTSTLSAIRAGFAIQNALKDWSQSTPASKLTTRIGIHTCSCDNNGYLQQLSQTMATSLEQLGCAKALCVSMEVIERIRHEMSFHDYPLGPQVLEYLPVPVRIFYLYEEKPGFLTRHTLQLKYLKNEYVDRFLNRYTLTASMASILLVSVLIFNTAASETRYIEFEEIKNFSEDNYKSEVDELLRQLKFRFDHMPGPKLSNDKSKQQSDMKLVCSFQQIRNNAQLSWAVYEQDGEIQTAGGVVSADIDDIDDLEELLVQDIITEIDVDLD